MSKKRHPDTITSADLPGLRATITEFAENELLASEFRAICRETVAAIDLAVVEDAATHARLQHALERFVRACSAEGESC